MKTLYFIPTIVLLFLYILTNVVLFATIGLIYLILAKLFSIHTNKQINNFYDYTIN